MLMPLVHVCLCLCVYRRAFGDEERRAKKDLKGKALAEKLQSLHNRKLDACERINTWKENAHGTNKGG